MIHIYNSAMRNLDTFPAYDKKPISSRSSFKLMTIRIGGKSLIERKPSSCSSSLFSFFLPAIRQDGLGDVIR